MKTVNKTAATAASIRKVWGFRPTTRVHDKTKSRTGYRRKDKWGNPIEK